MRSEELVVKALKDVLGDKLSAAELQQALEKPKSLALGDFAFPAFSLAKIFRKAPQQIAAEIAAQISQAHFEKVQAVGPYVNFFLNKSEFSQTILQTVLQQGQAYGNQDLGAAGNVPIDMSSPNIAKPISMGHLRSTVIGNSLAKLLRKANYRPIKINHLGDWGTQFGKLIEAYKLWGSEAEVKADPINKLLEY
ncbi:MAG: arginine--tRNA ligase, partial [Liquorilactobacillus satsumensis]